jgi:hypothetical protein
MNAEEKTKYLVFEGIVDRYDGDLHDWGLDQTTLLFADEAAAKAALDELKEQCDDADNEEKWSFYVQARHLIGLPTEQVPS